MIWKEGQSNGTFIKINANFIFIGTLDDALGDFQTRWAQNQPHFLGQKSKEGVFANKFLVEVLFQNFRPRGCIWAAASKPVAPNMLLLTLDPWGHIAPMPHRDLLIDRHEATYQPK